MGVNNLDRDEFFSRIVPMFPGKPRKLSPRLRQSIAVILDAWDKFDNNSDLRHLAYILATSFHETGSAMEPVKEKGGLVYMYRMYDKDGERPQVAKRLGNTQKGDGIRFSGAGHVQLTGRKNYEYAGKQLGIDLVGDPALAMDPQHSAAILIHGMYYGWFTSRKLKHYFEGGKADWTGARAIVNGADRAETIAKYGRSFYSALLESVTEDPPTPEGKPTYLSTTNIAATASGAGGLTIVADSLNSGLSTARTAANTAGELANSAGKLLPWLGWNQTTLNLCMGLAIVVLAGYIFYERVQKRSLGV